MSGVNNKMWLNTKALPAPLVETNGSTEPCAFLDGITRLYPLDKAILNWDLRQRTGWNLNRRPKADS